MGAVNGAIPATHLQSAVECLRIPTRPRGLPGTLYNRLRGGATT